MALSPSSSSSTKSSELSSPLETAHTVDVAAQLAKGVEILADAVDHLAPPIGLDDQPVGVDALLIWNTITLEL